MEKHKNDAKLSAEYWKSVNKEFHPQISWTIKSKFKSYNPNSRRCSLLLHGKLEIVDDPDEIVRSHHQVSLSKKTSVDNKKDCGITYNGSSWVQVLTKWLF